MIFFALNATEYITLNILLMQDVQINYLSIRPLGRIDK